MWRTMMSAGKKINLISNAGEAKVDVRRLTNETSEEIVARIRRIVGDPAVDVSPAPGQTMPATEPSSLSTALYLTMEKVFQQASAKAVVIPYMSRGATDGSYLREKGMAVYVAPIFLRENNESRPHGNDERISLKNLDAGTILLWQIVQGL